VVPFPKTGAVGGQQRKRKGVQGFRGVTSSIGKKIGSRRNGTEEGPVPREVEI